MSEGVRSASSCSTEATQQHNRTVICRWLFALHCKCLLWHGGGKGGGFVYRISETIQLELAIYYARDVFH